MKYFNKQNLARKFGNNSQLLPWRQNEVGTSENYARFPDLPSTTHPETLNVCNRKPEAVSLSEIQAL